VTADKLVKDIADPEISDKKLAEYWEQMDESFLRVVPWFYYPCTSPKKSIERQGKDGIGKV